MAGAVDAAAGGDVAQATSAAPAPGTVSDTNVQELGVDEPDLVKTDGEVIVTSVNGTVQVVDVASEQLVATIPLPADSFSAELLLDGDTLLVLASGAAPFVGGQADLLPAFQPTRTVVTRIDLGAPAAPTILGSGCWGSARTPIPRRGRPSACRPRCSTSAIRRTRSGWRRSTLARGTHRSSTTTGFLQWAPTGQVVLPAELYGPLPGQPADSYGSTFAGAVVLGVGDLEGAGSLAEAGRVANRDLAPGEYAPAVVRSMVIGESLWTLTNEGLARHGLVDLARQATVPLV